VTKRPKNFPISAQIESKGGSCLESVFSGPHCERKLLIESSVAYLRAPLANNESDYQSTDGT